RGCEHHAAADRNRLAAQARVEQLFDRRIKGVEVRVENGGCGTHLVASWLLTGESSARSRSEESRRLFDDERGAGGQASRTQCVCRRETGRARHTHQRMDTSRASVNAGPGPNRSATGAAAPTRRLSSVLSTRKRSKRARVKASRRAAIGRA